MAPTEADAGAARRPRGPGAAVGLTFRDSPLFGSADDAAGNTVALSDARVQGLTVEVRVVSATAYAPDTRVVDALATDRRLVVPV